MNVSADTHRCHKKVLGPPRTGVKTIVSCLTWVLVSELGLSVRTACGFNH